MLEDRRWKSTARTWQHCSGTEIRPARFGLWTKPLRPGGSESFGDRGNPADFTYKAKRPGPLYHVTATPVMRLGISSLPTQPSPVLTHYTLDVFGDVIPIRFQPEVI